MAVDDEFARARRAHVEQARRALKRHAGQVVLSGETAAIALNLPTYRIPLKPQLTRTTGSRRSRGRTDVSVAELPAGSVVMHDGMPVTSMARTVVDIARTRPFLEALVTADAAMRRGLPRRALEDVVVQMRKWPGTVAAAEVVRWTDGRSESACESVVRARFILLDLPLPDLQIWVRTPSGGRRVDFLWEAVGLIGEADGRIKYKEEHDLWDEKQRREDLEEERAVIRWTWRQAHAPDEEFRARFMRAWRRAQLLQAARGLSA